MTRINLVPVKCLTNKHLLAEYKEITRIPTAVEKFTQQGKTLHDVDIPNQYTLGKGHCKFFYNKLRFICARYVALHRELRVRNYNLNEPLFERITENITRLVADNPQVQIYWLPAPEEIYLNMARLCKRSKIESVINEVTSEFARKEV